MSTNSPGASRGIVSSPTLETTMKASKFQECIDLYGDAATQLFVRNNNTAMEDLISILWSLMPKSYTREQYWELKEALVLWAKL